MNQFLPRILKGFVNRMSIPMKSAQFEHWFRDVITFVSEPTLPQKASPSKRVVVGIAFAASLFLFVSLALLLEFVRQGNERERIEGGEKGER